MSGHRPEAEAVSDRTPQRAEKTGLDFKDVHSEQTNTDALPGSHAEIKLQTAELVKSGTLNDFQLQIPPGEATTRSSGDATSRPSGADTGAPSRADTLREKLTGSLSGLAEPEKFINHAISSTDQLTAASGDPARQQKILDDAVQQMTKDNPGADPRMLTRAMRTVMHQEGSSLSLIDEGSVAVLRDRNAITPENATGFVASSFVGSGTPALDERERRGFETARKINDVLTPIDGRMNNADFAAFHERLSPFLEAHENSGLFGPLTNYPGREHPRQPLSEAEQEKRLTSAFAGSLSTMPDRASLVKDVLTAGKELAFASPSEMEKKFPTVFEKLTADHPGASKEMVARMVAVAANGAAKTDNFSVSANSGEGVAYFRDSRLGNMYNSRGVVSAAYTGENNAEQRQAFDASMQIAGIMRNATRTEPELIKDGSTKRTVEGVYNMIPRVRP